MWPDGLYGNPAEPGHLPQLHPGQAGIVLAVFSEGELCPPTGTLVSLQERGHGCLSLRFHPQHLPFAGACGDSWSTQSYFKSGMSYLNWKKTLVADSTFRTWCSSTWTAGGGFVVYACFLSGFPFWSWNGSVLLYILSKHSCKHNLYPCIGGISLRSQLFALLVCWFYLDTVGIMKSETGNWTENALEGCAVLSSDRRKAPRSWTRSLNFQ